MLEGKTPVPGLRLARLSAAGLAVAYAALLWWTSGGAAWIFIVGLTVLLFGRTGLSLMHKPSARNTSRARSVAAIIPFYNESAEGLRSTFCSLFDQTRLPDELFIINDGSVRGTAEVLQWLPVLRRKIRRVEYIDLVENKGKRSALAAAFRATECDVIVTIDSDTTLDPRAIEEVVRPFSSRKVMAVTGRIGVRNRSRNLLTLLQDVIYGTAFLHGRAALSQVGSVLVCSGALSAYRRSVIEPNLGDFMSRPWMFGEDRHLTNYALRYGKVVLQDSATAMTDVPGNLRHYLRQQTRWQRGYLQNSIWILKRFPLDHRVFWLTLGKTVTWVLFTFLIPYGLATGGLTHLVAYGLVAHLLVSWSHLVRFAACRNDVNGWMRLATFFVGPALGFVQALILAPVRLYALVTFGAKGWGSRIREQMAVEPAVS